MSAVGPRLLKDNLRARLDSGWTIGLPCADMRHEVFILKFKLVTTGLWRLIRRSTGLAASSRVTSGQGNLQRHNVASQSSSSTMMDRDRPSLYPQTRRNPLEVTREKCALPPFFPSLRAPLPHPLPSYGSSMKILLFTRPRVCRAILVQLRLSRRPRG